MDRGTVFGFLTFLRIICRNFAMISSSVATSLLIGNKNGDFEKSL
jgi:hypothetical protein